jgi:hypothetical protein
MLRRLSSFKVLGASAESHIWLCMPLHSRPFVGDPETFLRESADQIEMEAEFLF